MGLISDRKNRNKRDKGGSTLAMDAVGINKPGFMPHYHPQQPHHHPHHSHHPHHPQHHPQHPAHHHPLNYHPVTKGSTPPGGLIANNNKKKIFGSQILGGQSKNSKVLPKYPAGYYTTPVQHSSSWSHNLNNGHNKNNNNVVNNNNNASNNPRGYQTWVATPRKQPSLGQLVRCV